MRSAGLGSEGGKTSLLGLTLLGLKQSLSGPVVRLWLIILCDFAGSA